MCRLTFVQLIIQKRASDFRPEEALPIRSHLKCVWKKKNHFFGIVRWVILNAFLPWCCQCKEPLKGINCCTFIKAVCLLITNYMMLKQKGFESWLFFYIFCTWDHRNGIHDSWCPVLWYSVSIIDVYYHWTKRSVMSPIEIALPPAFWEVRPNLSMIFLPYKWSQTTVIGRSRSESRV